MVFAVVMRFALGDWGLWGIVGDAHAVRTNGFCRVFTVVMRFALGGWGLWGIVGDARAVRANGFCRVFAVVMRFALGGRRAVIACRIIGIARRGA